jgi:hypothetical protein
MALTKGLQDSAQGFSPQALTSVGLTMTSTVPPGRGSFCITTQALRAWLLSCCPSGTKSIRPSKRLTVILALIG